LKKVGLFFGTFNPIHVGHLIIANYMINYTDMKEVWLVVSPQNPLKDKKTLLADHHRLAIVKVAIEGQTKIKACDIEFSLSKPSYTVHTLAYLAEKYPKLEFSLIMGEDNIRTLHKWKNYEFILENFDLYIYPRLISDEEKKSGINNALKSNLRNTNRIKKIEVPIMQISASFLRESIKAKKDVRYWLTEPVYKYVKEMHFYEK
jgi:nicotinate-nucleotide adenylyltransferase